MASQKTARERRAAERATRRAALPDVDDTVDEIVAESGEHTATGDALKTAASAALAAAAVGAARALAQRRGHDADADTDTDGSEEPEHEDTDDEREPQAEHVQSPPPEAELGDVGDDEPEPEQREPAPPGRARAMIDRAKDHLRDLRDAEAEAVSSIHRTRDGWRVALDVVEVHRIPESTDVLATYELDLDDDGELVTLERTARFYRSEADRR